MRRFPVLCVMLLAAAGCRSTTPIQTRAELEISHTPSILHNRMQEWPQMKLYGVGIGDDESTLSPKKIRTRNDAGWVTMRNGARYLIQDRKVAGLGVWDQRLLAPLSIRSRADIEAKFGKPQSIDDLGKEKIYRYADNHVRVMWNDFEKRVTTVNVVN